MIPHFSPVAFFTSQVFLSGSRQNIGSRAWDLHQGDQLQANPQGQTLLEGQNQGFQGVPLKSIAKYLRCSDNSSDKRGEDPNIDDICVLCVWIEIILDYIDMVWHVAMHILIRVSLHECIYITCWYEGVWIYYHYVFISTLPYQHVMSCMYVIYIILYLYLSIYIYMICI